MALTEIGIPIVKAVFPVVLGFLKDKVSQIINPSELEQALVAAIDAANQQDDSARDWLCKNCPSDHCLPNFLKKVVEHPDFLRELQKPLNREGTISSEVFTRVLQQIAQQEKIELKVERMQPWIQTFKDTFFEKTASIRFEVAKEDYLNQLSRWFSKIVFAGVAVPGNEVDASAELPEIFVIPDLKQEVRESDIPTTAPNQEASDRQSQRLLKNQRQAPQSERVLSADMLLRTILSNDLIHQPNAVILGAPGLGKTTLLSYFAIALASKLPLWSVDITEKYIPEITEEYLPMLVHIRDWAKQPQMSLVEFVEQYAESTLTVKKLPQGFFEHWLEAGRTLILIDGLDEAPSEAQRQYYVQYIETFLHQYRGNRAIITTRIAGYRRDFFRTHEFPHYELLPFDSLKVDQFISAWYRSRINDVSEADRRKEVLLQSLDNNERVRLLAQNPLILTIVALIHRYQTILPKERHELYETAVRTLLVSWDAHKELNYHRPLEFLTTADLRRLVEQLAYWIHTQGQKGNQIGGTLIDKEDLAQQLSKMIKELKSVPLHEAQAEAERFLVFIRERTGLINEQGQGCYAFVHKTFQEYLCSREIIYQAENESDPQIILNCLVQHLHNPHWQEVLLLLIAQQKPKPAAKAISAILNAGSEYEQWLHRDLLFASQCLIEAPENLTTHAEGSSLVSQILKELVHIGLAPRLIKSAIYRDRFSSIVVALSNTPFAQETLERIKEYLQEDSGHQLLQCKLMLGDLQESGDALVSLIEDRDFSDWTVKKLTEITKFAENRSFFVEKLLAINPRTIDIVEALRRLGYWDELSNQIRNEFEYEYYAQADLDADYERHMKEQHLKEMEEADSIYSELKPLFEALNQGEEAAIGKLIDWLEFEEYGIPGYIMKRFEEAAQHNDKIVEKILQRLINSSADERANLTVALGYLSSSPSKVIDILAELLEDGDIAIRSCAAYSLSRLGLVNDQSLNILLSWLMTEDVSARRLRTQASKVLLELSRTNDHILPSVLQCLQQSTNSDYVGAAIDTLWGIVEDLGDTAIFNRAWYVRTELFHNASNLLY